MNGTQAFRDEHAALLEHLEHLRVAAAKLPTMSSVERGETISRILDFFRGTLIPHAEAEEAVLYPAVARVLGHPEATATMISDHREIVARIQALEDAGPEDIVRLQELLYGLYALLIVHFREEEDDYLPLLEQQSPEELPEILAQMGEHGMAMLTERVRRSWTARRRGTGSAPPEGRRGVGACPGAKATPAADAVGGGRSMVLIDCCPPADLEGGLVTVEPLHHPHRLLGRLLDRLVERMRRSEEHSRLAVDRLAEAAGDGRPPATDQENGLLDQTDTPIGAISPARQRCPACDLRHCHDQLPFVSAATIGSLLQAQRNGVQRAGKGLSERATGSEARATLLARVSFPSKCVAVP